MGLKNGTPGRRVDTGKFICTHCKNGQCVECIDLKRAVYTTEKVCECPKHKTPKSSSFQPRS